MRLPAGTPRLKVGFGLARHHDGQPITKLARLLQDALGEDIGVDRLGRPGTSDEVNIVRHAAVLAERTLLYLDPPYFGSEGYYGAGLFERGDFARLAEQLAAVRGAFILSINDAPEIRETFAAFALEAVDLTYTLAGAEAAMAARELIVTPYGLPSASPRQRALFDEGSA